MTGISYNWWQYGYNHHKPPSIAYELLPSNSTNKNICNCCGREGYGSIVKLTDDVAIFKCYICQGVLPKVMTLSNTGVL